MSAAIPIVYWHHIGSAPTRALSPYCVSPATFEEQLDALLAAGFESVTFDDVRTGRLPEQPVVLTFDDGYRSVVEHAGPAMEQRGLRGVVFVVAGQVGGVNDWDRGASALRLVDDTDLRSLTAAGHEVGVHGWEHAPFDQTAPADLRLQLLAARARLEAVVDAPVRSLSYPFGRCDGRVIDVVAACGFDVACLDGRVAEPGWTPALALTRAEMTATADADTVASVEWPALAPAPVSDVLAFDTLVAATLDVGPQRSAATAWGAVHRRSGPLIDVLAARQSSGGATVREFVKHERTGDWPVAHVLSPLADDIDAALERTPRTPVFDVAEPSEAPTPDGVRLGPWGTDLVRLLWTMPPEDEPAVVRAYLHAAGRPARRRHVAAALVDITRAELALVCEDAMEGVASREQVEWALASLPDHEDVAPMTERDDEMTARRHLAIATGALVRQRSREHYRGSALGLLWAAAQPLSLFAVLAAVFGRVVSIGVADYPAFLLAGLLPWLFVQRSLGEAVGSIRGRGYLLRLSAFPPVALPLSVVTAAAIELGAQVVVAAPLVTVLADGNPARLLALPPLAVLLFALALAGALVVSGLSVRYRDVGHAVPVAIGVAFYLVPVIYPASRVPGGWRALYRLDPAAVLVEAFRASTGTGPWPPAWALGATVVTVSAALALSLRWFSRRVDEFVAEA